MPLPDSVLVLTISVNRAGQIHIEASPAEAMAQTMVCVGLLDVAKHEIHKFGDAQKGSISAPSPQDLAAILASQHKKGS